MRERDEAVRYVLWTATATSTARQITTSNPLVHTIPLQSRDRAMDAPPWSNGTGVVEQARGEEEVVFYGVGHVDGIGVSG